MIGIAWFPKNIAVEHHDRIRTDDNTIRRIGASGDYFTPCQESWVRRQGHWAGR
jgi:hypothetical protein